MTDRELMQQALDALEGYARNCRCEGGGAPCDAAEALRARLAQPEPEPVVIDPDGTVRLIKHSPQPKIGQDPVAWVDKAGAVIPRSHKLFKPEFFVDYTIPLYTAPPQREWQGLTDEEIWKMDAYRNAAPYEEVRVLYLFARAIEAKLKEKNT